MSEQSEVITSNISISRASSYLHQLSERIRLCRDNDEQNPIARHSNPKNCVGTALFLLGLKEDEKHVSIYDVPELQLLKKSDVPALGGAVAWEADVSGRHDVVHMGVVTSLDPLLVSGRKGYCEAFVENQPFQELEEKCVAGHKKSEVVFYLPPDLTRIGEELAKLQEKREADRKKFREELRAFFANYNAPLEKG